MNPVVLFESGELAPAWDGPAEELDATRLFRLPPLILRHLLHLLRNRPASEFGEFLWELGASRQSRIESQEVGGDPR